MDIIEKIDKKLEGKKKGKEDGDSKGNSDNSLGNNSGDSLNQDNINVITSLKKLANSDLTEEYLFPVVSECISTLSSVNSEISKAFMSKISPLIQEMSQDVLRQYLPSGTDVDNLPAH